MRRLSSLLVVVGIIVIGLGFYRGWFTVSGTRENEGNTLDVTLSVDPDKVKDDAELIRARTGSTKAPTSADPDPSPQP